MISNEQQATKRPRILIVGCGFGGIELAKSLKKQPVDILMLDKHNYHTFQPLLYQVAMGAIEADSIAFPIRRIFSSQQNLTFHMADVHKIDPENNCVITNIGNFSYDYLVIATGSNTNFFGNKQIECHTMPMKNLPEALNMRSLVLQNVEKALVTTDPAEKAALLTFVVVGGGPTGVELSGALAEMRRHILGKEYPGLKMEDMRVYLAEGKAELLAAMSEPASVKAKQFLIDLGVTIFNSVHVQSYVGEELKIDDGQTIKTRNVFWAAGVKGEVPEGVPLQLVNRAARIQTDEFNRLKGYQHIFAIGDVAAVTTTDLPNGHPGVAQVAIQQGKHLAKNIGRLVNGETPIPFIYKDKGSMATVGRNKAVADIGKLHFQGFFAWMIWMFVHLLSLAGFSNKVTVFFRWALNYISKNSDNRLVIRYFNTETMMAEPIAK